MTFTPDRLLCTSDGSNKTSTQSSVSRAVIKGKRKTKAGHMWLLQLRQTIDKQDIDITLPAALWPWG
jgi:hypothetical protein